jgi:Fe-S oxidoreductase
MIKSELLPALQNEIQKHNLSTFMDEKDKVVITGCTLCRKHFGTVENFKKHLTEDVLPQLLDKLSVETK